MLGTYMVTTTLRKLSPLLEHQVCHIINFKSLGSCQVGAVRASELYRILQEVLIERDLPFMIAPYSAGAQVRPETGRASIRAD
jgi:hypothetical protein